MIRVLHCADLHLTAEPAGEREYSLAVLDEIVSLAKSEGAAFLLFAGDTFNSFDDAAELRAGFRERMASLRGACEVILVAGNHEDLGRGARKLASFDLGIAAENCVEFDGAFFRLICREGIEFLAVPHQPDYRGYTEWKVPAKRAPVRIAVAHGIVAGMSYTGDDGESDARAAVMDADLFQRHGADYAALGHIHAGRSQRQGATDIVYPGSARVWRRNEYGPRRVALLDVENAVRVSARELSSAGEYRSLDLFVNFGGDIDALPPETRAWGRNDYVSLRFFGVVENETVAGDAIDALTADIGRRVRRVEAERDLAVLDGISAQPIARKFLDTWKSAGPRSDDPADVRAWLRARELGLLRIKELLEARS
ncbi:MAG TPA: DNA repair exonuclease [Spirochaetota bacterium]|nr:DNA repair exonuclease [Spirochaetota bacterium]